MLYRVEKLPLTTAHEYRGRSGTLARLPSRRTRLPKSAYTNFQLLSRRLARNTFRLDADLEGRACEFLKAAGGGKRHFDALRTLTRNDGFAVVVPLLRGVAAPRMDEVLRLVTGIELARELRARKLGRVSVVAWPMIPVGEAGESGISAIYLRSGVLQDIGFVGGDTERYLRQLRSDLPGTGFSALLLDQLTRAADPDANLFKARLLLRWLDDEGVTLLPPAEGQDANTSLRRMFEKLPLLAVVGQGLPTAGIPPGEPVPFPAMSSTIVEGKVEAWLQRLGLTAEDVLSGNARPDDVARRAMPEDAGNGVAAFKERVLSQLLRFELALNDLGFRPAAEIRNALNGFDLGADRLRPRAVAEATREGETQRAQAVKIVQHLLPEGRPQQEVMSLLHYLDFYGPEFLPRLRSAVQADDLRHQVVYVADK
ncbi:MAG: bacillithiol biosynthesis BshC [Planctomycetes bacterium]|nr:bacillithiol biosynthesis BshC [Planctomycetota bacterium]